MTGRYEDWPKRLEAAIEAARVRRFSWGQHDCMLFAASVVQALTGRDVAAQHRGQYKGSQTAAAYTARHGGMATMVTKVLGDPVRPIQARRGDVVMRCDERGPALGVCVGAQAAFAGLRGLILRPLDECIQAWPV